MQSILVQKIHAPILTGCRNDAGRYVEILPIAGRDVRQGTIATFFEARSGRKVCGKVETCRTSSGDVLVVDTFTVK